MTEWADAILRDYVDETGNVGANAAIYLQRVLDAHAEDPSGAQSAIEELLTSLAHDRWRTDPAPIPETSSQKKKRNPGQGEIWPETIRGIELPNSYNFDDPSSPTGFSRVSKLHATVRHVTADLIVKQRKRDELDRATIKAGEEAAVIVAAANGDPDMPLWAICDQNMRGAA